METIPNYTGMQSTPFQLPLDYFGIAGSMVMKQLQDQSSNKRARKVAFNTLCAMAKGAKVLNATTRVVGICLEVAPDGTQFLTFNVLKGENPNG